MALNLYHFKNANIEVQVQRIAHGAYVIRRRCSEVEWKTIGQFSTRTVANQSAQQFVRGFLLTPPVHYAVNEMIREMIKAGILDERPIY